MIEQRDEQTATAGFSWPAWFVDAFADAQDYSNKQARRITKGQMGAWSFSKAECEQLMTGAWPSGDIPAAWRKGAPALSGLTERSDFIIGSQDPIGSDRLLRGNIGEAMRPDAKGLEWERAGVAWRGASENQRFWLSLFAVRNWVLIPNGEGWLRKWGRLKRFNSAADLAAYEQQQILDKFYGGSRARLLEHARNKITALPKPLF